MFGLIREMRPSRLWVELTSAGRSEPMSYRLFRATVAQARNAELIVLSCAGPSASPEGLLRAIRRVCATGAVVEVVIPLAFVSELLLFDLSRSGVHRLTISDARSVDSIREWARRFAEFCWETERPPELQTIAAQFTGLSGGDTAHILPDGEVLCDGVRCGNLRSQRLATIWRGR